MRTLIAYCRVLIAYCAMAGMTFTYYKDNLFRKRDYHERTAHTLRIARKIDQLTRRKYGLKMSGEGTLNELKFDKTRGSEYNFISNCYLNADQGRELVVKITLEVLKIHNEDLKYRKFLYEYPFNIKNVGISIFTKEGPRREKVLPNIYKAGLHRKHLRISYFMKDQMPEKMSDSIYYKSYKTHYETFRMAIHRVQDKLPADLLKVAQELDLLNGNLEDDDIDSSIEDYRELTTKKAILEGLKKDYKCGELTQTRFKELVVKTECNMPEATREERTEKYKELFRNGFISENRMRKLIELEENTEPYIQED